MKETKPDAPIYTMLFRPVSSFTLPNGITTEWVRLPRTDGYVMADAFPHLTETVATLLLRPEAGRRNLMRVEFLPRVVPAVHQHALVALDPCLRGWRP